MPIEEKRRERTFASEAAIRLMKPVAGSCGLSQSKDCEATYWEKSNAWWCPFLDNPCEELRGSVTRTNKDE